MKGFFDTLVRQVIARHRLVLIVAAALFFGSIALSFRLRLDPDILNLVPRGNREIDEFRRVLEGLGTIDQHLVVVELPQGSDPGAYEPLIALLAQRFRAMPEVASVDAEIPDLMGIARELLPYALLYFAPGELPQIESRLTDAAIRESIAQNAALLQTPQSTVAKQLVQWDPFRLAPLLLQKARPGGSAMNVDTSTGYILSAGRTMYLLNVKPKRSAHDIPFARTLVERSRSVADSAAAVFRRENPEAEPPAIGFAGGYAVAVSDAALIRKDVTINVVSSIVLILLLFLYAFRNLASIGYAAVPMILSIALTFGFAALALGRLSSASAVFGALVAGLGIDFVTITYERYLACRSLGEPVPAALRTAWVATMPGVLVAALTTAGTFYAYLLTDYRGMSELGLLVGTGVVFSLVAVAVVVPALIVVVEGRRREPRPVQLRTFGSGHLVAAAIRRPGVTIVLWIVLVAVAGFVARGIRFDPEISSFRSKDNPAAALQERVSKAFGQGLSAMLYVEERPTLEAALEATARRRPELDRLVREGAIGSYHSMAALLPPLDQQRAMIALAERRAASTLDFARIERTFRSALEANGFRSTGYDEYLQSFRMFLRPARPLDYATLQQTSLAPLLHRFVRQRGDLWMSVTYLYPKNRAWPPDVPEPILRFRERTDGVVTGVNLVSMTLRRIIQRDAVRSTLWGFVAVFVLFAIFQRSLGRASLMFVPLLAGCTVMVGAMAAFGLPFNLVNAFVGLMLVGVATDYAVYLVQGYRENPRNFALQGPHTAKAVTMAALTSMVGFGSFITSHFPGMRSIGYTSLLGIGFSCLAAITLLPAILVLRGRKS